MSIARIDYDSLYDFTLRAFLAAGFREDDSRRATDVLMWATVRGVDTHGIRNLKRYYVDSAGGIGQRDGVILFDASPSIDAESPESAAWNANGGLGLSIAVQAMDSAIAKAREHGVGMVTVRNSTHFGAAGYYAHMAVAEDMIGIASTGYFFPHGQEKAVIPFGGLLPLLSTNPLAMACPCNTQPPFVLDMSTSVVPVNRVEMFEELGKPIPANWALDAEHRPTTDPTKVEKVAPLGGATEFGGHKGYGLALAVWILTSVLSGGWRTDPQTDRILGERKELKNGFGQEGVGHFFAAVRLDRFGDPDMMKRGMDSMIQTLNESPAANEDHPVLSPGQGAHATEIERRQNGIPLPQSTLDELHSLSQKFDIPLRLR